MRPSRTRSRALALLVAMCPLMAFAQVGDELRLKLERQLRMAPTRPERDSAKFLEADHLETTGDKKVTATGNVHLRQRGAAIRADRIDYDGEAQTALATGSVRIERNGDAASGPSLLYHLDTDAGEMPTPVFEFPRTAERRVATRGNAERGELEQQQKSRLLHAYYTSCPVPRNDWYLSVRELDIDSSRNVGTAYSSTLFFLGMPILYTPYITFALDNKRRSGFLAPTLGNSSKSGFEAALPYYWNIAPNADATITPKIFTKRGLQLGGEFRYLEPKLAGEIDAEYLPDDRQAQRDRFFAGIRHSQRLGNGWSAAINAQEVSDNNYFRDLSTKIALTSQSNLPHDFALAYGDDTWSFLARALTYQTLQDPLGAPVPIPYRILPQLVFNGARQNVHGLDWSFASEISNFEHPTLVSGQRLILYPSIAMPFRRSYGYVIPKVGFHYTRYDLGSNAQGAEDGPIALPIASLDSGLYFDRQMKIGDRAFQQTLEPRLYYLYVPFRDQSQLPNFTTADKDFNFSQIFTENRFVGGDRVGDANQITMALTSRLIESSTGLERLTASLGQVYYFTPPRVTLGETLTDSKSSDILAALGTRMSSSVGVDASFQYTPTLDRSEKLTIESHYSPAPGSVVNAAYRYARGSSDPRADPSVQAGIAQVDLSSQWPITSQVTGLARWNWSTQDRKLLEGLVGFEYNAGCWQVRAVAHRFITSTQQYSTSFQIQLELAGLSRIGINPLETLRQNISGYRRSDEIPQ